MDETLCLVMGVEDQLVVSDELQNICFVKCQLASYRSWCPNEVTGEKSKYCGHQAPSSSHYSLSVRWSGDAGPAKINWQMLKGFLFLREYFYWEFAIKGEGRFLVRISSQMTDWGEAAAAALPEIIAIASDGALVILMISIHLAQMVSSCLDS